ncbi:MAG: DegV family protein [Anaerolineales bacterium]
MARVCILTDSTAQFTRPNFPGQDRIYLLPFRLQTADQESGAACRPKVIPPSVHDFSRFFDELGREYDAILTLTLAASLSPAAEHARQAAGRGNKHVEIEVVDSGTTAAGLGLLVQAAAAAAAAGASLAEVEARVRSAIPRLYMLICIPELSYLSESGHLTPAQAIVGEMLGLMPIFSLEEGRLAPMEKVRTQRHLFESFQEFISEFDQPYHIALMRGVNHDTLRTRPLREYVQELFPQTHFTEHNINAHLAALLGPQSIGLIVVEEPFER